MEVPKSTTVASEPLPADGTEPALEPVVTPTVTHYQQIAAQFCALFDQAVLILPKLEVKHSSTSRFVRTHQNIPIPFMATAISAVEQTVELQSVGKLDAANGRDTLQFQEAFRPVYDKIQAFADSLNFTMDSRIAYLAADSLQLYDVAKGLARDPNGAVIAGFVEIMQRDLGRSGRPRTKKPTTPNPAPAAPPAPVTPGNW